MIKKIKDIVIYRDQAFFSSFPAVAALPGGKLQIAFRRAPNYCGLPGMPEDHVYHLDYNSQLMTSVSDDGGEHWSTPELLYAPPNGCCQDGGMYFDGKYVYANSFVWGYIPERVAQALEASGKDEYLIGRLPHPDWLTAVPLGSVLFRKKPEAPRWEGPFVPNPAPDGTEVLPGVPRRMHNRANVLRGTDGSLLWCGELYSYKGGYHASIELSKSLDDGKTFQYLATPAPDYGHAVFEEPYLYITPSGKYVILIRCHKNETEDEYHDHALLYVTESLDQGKTWSKPYNTGIHAEPPAACRLDDGRVLLVYGYRIPPKEGVRARICNPELTDIAEAQEFIIRDDGGRFDTGYPWVVPLGNNRYFVVYYNDNIIHRGAAGIEASILEITD